MTQKYTGVLFLMMKGVVSVGMNVANFEHYAAVEEARFEIG